MISAGEPIAHPSMFDFSIYLLYRAGSFLVRGLPVQLIFSIGQVLGFIAWILSPAYRRLALRNLEIAFDDEKSDRELRRIIRRHFQLLVANLLSSVKISAIPLEKIGSLFETENAEAVHRELRAGRPVVLVLSHLGNWELLTQCFPQLFNYVRIGTVYQKLGNRYIDEHVRIRRARAGVELFDRSSGFRKPIELLKSGGLVGVLSDQHAGDHGLWTPFFDRLASTTPLPALLARRTGAALIAAAPYTTRFGHWKIVFTDRFDTPGESVEALTAKGNEVIARQIRHAPEDWFWVHNRWKTPKPNFLLKKYKRGVFVPPELAPEKLKPFRILIRATNWLGDNVMSLPAVRAIKSGRPDAHVTIAAAEKIASVWRLVPEVDEVIPLPACSLRQTVRILRKEPLFDVAILFPNSLRVALEAWLAGVRRRIGYRGHYRRWLLDQVVTDQQRSWPLLHQAEHYLDITRELGADLELGEIVPTDLKRSKNLPRIKLGLCPGAEYGPAKRWLPERFAEVAGAISEKLPADWILFGTSKDAEVGAVIAERLADRCVNRIGQTTLDQLIAELRECEMLLTNDTGTMHLATLLGVTVVAVFGSTEPRLTGPLGPGHRVLRHQVECSPCFLPACPIDFRCMKAVTVEEVIAAAISVLSTRVA